MASVKWNDAVEHVSGALKKINKKSQHAADQKMILATHRVAESKSKDCCRLYVRGIEAVTRTTPVKASELAHRTKFAAVAAAVRNRIKATSPTYETDYAAYKAQKDLSNGQPTFRSYLFADEWAKYQA